MRDADPAVAERRRAPQRRRRFAAEDDRRAGLLHRLGAEAARRHLVEAAGEARRVLAPQRPHQADRLARAGGAIGERHAGRLEFVGQPADADAEQEAAVGQDVERRCRLRHRHRVAQRQHEDAGAELDALGAGGDVGERDEGIVQRDGRAAGKLPVGRVRIRAAHLERHDEVLRQPHRFEAQRLGFARHLAEHLRPRRRAAAHRMQCELHGGAIPAATGFRHTRWLSRRRLLASRLLAAKNAKGAKQRCLAPLAFLAANKSVTSRRPQ